jgi:hypothetical protein
MVDSSAEIQSTEPRGFGGWLWAWNFYTFVLQPVGLVASVFYSSDPKAAGRAFFSGALMVLLLWTWSVVTEKSPRSLRWIRRYMIAMFVLACLALQSGITFSVDAARIKSILAISYDESSYQEWLEKTDLAGTLILNSFLIYLYVVISWLYFRTSRRVRNTFGANLGPLWG